MVIALEWWWSQQAQTAGQVVLSLAIKRLPTKSFQFQLGLVNAESNGAPKKIKNQKETNNFQLIKNHPPTEVFKNMVFTNLPYLSCWIALPVDSCQVDVGHGSKSETQVHARPRFAWFFCIRKLLPKTEKETTVKPVEKPINCMNVCFSHEISSHQQMGFCYILLPNKKSTREKHPLLLWTEAFCPRTVTSPHFSLVKICKTWSPCGCWEILKNTTHFIPYHPWDWYIYLHEWLIFMVFM